MKEFFRKKEKNQAGYYENSTQKWLPIENIKNGIILLKDGRYIKTVEVLPVNFYLKSETEQENIIYYFASYLKIAPDNMQIRVITQRSDTDDYLNKLERLADNERNELCSSMIRDEMSFIKGLSDNSAIKKRFFIVFESKAGNFFEAQKGLSDEAYRAERYLSQCGLEVLDICDDGFLIDLFYAIINKHTSKYIKPGNFAESMFDEIHLAGGYDE